MLRAHGDGRLGVGVAAGVVDDRLQGALQKLAVEGHAQRAVGWDDAQLHAALGGERAVAFGHRPGGGEGVGLAGALVGVGAGGGQQRVEGAGHLVGRALDRRPGGGLRAGRVVGQGELGLGADAGQRRAQLVGELGREALLAPQAGGQAGEQAVERGGQLGELVARGAEVEAALEVALAPVGGLGGHAGHRAQAGGQRPAGGGDRRQQQRGGQGDRGHERDPLRALVGLE